MRRVQVGPMIGLGCALALLGALTAEVGLGVPALVWGAAAAVVTCVLLLRGMAATGLDRLGGPNRVTLVRATLVVGVSALVVQSWATSVPRPLVVSLSAVALVLDAVDGWLARRNGSLTRLGAAFDMETDAFLILVLSVYVAPVSGWWVLAIGLARYLLLAAAQVWRWLATPTPPRTWAKVVAAVQGVVLAAAASDVLPGAWSRALLAGALALLVESFGHQTWSLWRRRRNETAPVRAPWLRPVVDVLAVAFVWLALALPPRPDLVSARALVTIPVELLVFLALALVLPAVWGRVLAGLGGLLLALTLVVTTLDLGFYEGLDRPFDPLSDPSYAGSGLDLLESSLGRTGQVAVVAGIGLGVLLAVLLCVWAALRAGRAVRTTPGTWLRVTGVLTLLWTVADVAGASVNGVSVAAAPAASLLRAQIDQVQADLRDRAAFDREMSHDSYTLTPGDELLTHLRGKDVLLVFVESYGRVAVQGTWFAPQVDQTLGRVTGQLGALGFGARSGYLRSPTFGGISWLAHSTAQTGLWIDSQQRYDQVLAGDRFTLSQAFGRAGWRTVGDVPSDGHGWPQGKQFYRYDQMYGASNVGYRGPRFSYARVPDQYTFKAFYHRELQPRHRRPVMAEIDLDSSHTPWTPLPHLVPWHQLGHGSIYDGMTESHASLLQLLAKRGDTQRNYAHSIRYSLHSLVSFVRHAHDDNLVMVVLGDHQPHTVVSGLDASHDVPISLIAHDPSVLDRISSWGWISGMLPDPHGPVMRMDHFRNHFLSAFGSKRTLP
jgi:phosphatidylglycerophosphate synthase